MKSGCPNSQGGAYSAFQHRTIFGALPLPQEDISVTTVPVVYPENGIKNMLATQYPGELRVVSVPAQQESQPSTVSTGFQRPIPRDSACTSRHIWHQMNGDADFYSSAHVSAQYSSYFKTLANERSVRHPDSVQRWECSKHSFSRHCLKESNLNIETGLQRRQLQNSASSPGNNSAALQGDDLVVGSQAYPLQDQCFSATECEQQRSCPLLVSLLKGNHTDSKSFTTPSPSSKETTNIELNTITKVSDQRLYTGLRDKSPLVALNCGQTRSQNLDHSGGTIFSPHLQQVSSRSLSSQLSRDRVSPVGEMEGLTDGQILDIIEKRLAYFRTVLKNREYGHFSNHWDRDSTLHSDHNMPNVSSIAYLPTASDKKYAERQGLNCAVTEQCPAAVGQALEEESSKGSKANAESKEMVDCATSASQRNSPDDPQSMVNVAATCTKNEDESQVVPTAVPGMMWDGRDENQHSLRVNCSSLQKEYKAFLTSISPYLEDVDHAPGDSLALKHTKQRDNGGISQKPVEPVGSESVQGMTEVLEDLQIKSSPVVSENKTFKDASFNENQDAIPKTQINIDDQQYCDITYMEAIVHCKLQNQIHNIVSVPTNQSEWLGIQTSRVRSPTNLSTALSENVKHAPLSGSEDVKALPQYEDISDDESQLATELPNTEHEELSLSAYSENPKYEDISEDESPQIEYMAAEMSSEVPEPNGEQPPFENEGNGHVQGQAPTNTEIILDEELSPKKQVSPAMETFDVARFVSDSGFEGLLSSKDSVSCSPSSVLEDKFETDDQIEDDFLVIPIIVSDLKFEPLGEDQDSPEENILDVGETGDEDGQRDTSPTQCSALKPVPASAFSPMEEFDTVTTFVQNYKNRLELASRNNTSEHEMDSESELHTSQNRRDSVDSGETEDSCDYSPELAYTNNSLTVSRKMLMKRSQPLSSETEESESEKESDNSEVTNMQKGQTPKKLGMLIKSKAVSKHVQAKTNRQNMSKMDIIIIDLDDSSSEDHSDAPCSQQNRHSPETVDSLSGTVEEGLEKKDQDMGIILISDSEDDNHVKPKREPRREQKRRSSETVDSDYRTTKEELQETRPSSADSSQPQHQSTCHDSHYKEVMQDACSDLSDRMKKSQQPIEAKGCSEHVPHKASRKTTTKRRVTFHDDIVFKKSNFSKKKEYRRILPSSQSEDSGDDSFDTKNSVCGTSNERPHNNRLSSEDSPQRQPYSADNETDSAFGPVPVIPRLVVVKSSQPNQNLKLLKEARVHRQGKDGSKTQKTIVASSKKTDSCEKNALHFNKNDQGQTKPKPAKPDRQYETKNNIQASVPKPRMVSRQLSSPRQEGPDTFLSTLSSTNGQLSETRQSSASSQDLSQSGETSASCSPPTSKQSTSIPRQQMSSSKLVRSHSYSSPSTLNHPPTRGPSSSAATQSSAREPKSKLYEAWANDYFPTRRDRKTSLDVLSTKNDSRREARPGPSHQDRAPRPMRHESDTPLMKKAKMVAIQRTKDINRDASREQRCSVGAGYKWSEKPTGKANKRLQRGWEEDWSLPEPPESP